MSESSKVEGGGAAAAVGSTYASVAGSPVEEGWGGVPEEEESTLERLKLACIWAALCLRKVAPIGAIIWPGSDIRNSSKPKCKRI